jgi:hypothetical protein
MTDAVIRSQLRMLPVYSYRVYLRACEDAMYLPPYLGSTIRGALGASLKECLCSSDRKCNGCSYSLDCVYYELYEKSVNDANIPGVYDVPRPFIIRPPLEYRTQYQCGDTLKFELVLLGDTYKLLPYLILGMISMGQRGLGANRSKFELDRIACGNGLVFSTDVGQVRWYGEALSEETLLGAGLDGCSNVMLDFLTPTRIKHDSLLTSDLTFEVLVRSILRRSVSLITMYGQGVPKFDTRLLLEQAKQVQTTSCKFRWDDLRRYSNKQRATLSIGGFTGSVTYAGELELFRSLLHFGSVVSIGKGSVFGLGQYNMLWY